MFRNTLRSPWRIAVASVPVLAVVSVAAVAVSGVGSASAAAKSGTVTVQGSQIVFTAGDGTVNHLAVRSSGPNGIELEDTGADLVLSEPFGSCTQDQIRIVYCPVNSSSSVRANLGDGNDSYNSLFTPIRAEVYGSDGDDTFYGSPASDFFRGGPGDDIAYGSAGDDWLDGESGTDTLYGNDGSDTIWGGGGNDTTDGGPGNDQLHGGLGDDVINGDSGNDVLVGEYAGADTVSGGDGDDTVTGGWDAGTVIHGDAGNDRFKPGAYGDYYGGSGIDTADYSGWGKVWIALDNSGNDGPFPCGDVIGCPVTIKHNMHDDVENVVGSPGDDVVIGSETANDIDAGTGTDRIDGRGGNDYLDAGQGTGQTVTGGTGTDTCVGYSTTFVTCENL
ncbi:MAG: hypothetical protein QOD41_191 [Cryptosporangiaceae bacterium]|nr:hypothetical protein [Cryptosporangiaceae bacterium]